MHENIIVVKNRRSSSKEGIGKIGGSEVGHIRERRPRGEGGAGLV